MKTHILLFFFFILLISFAACESRQKTEESGGGTGWSEEDKSKYLEEGKQIALATFGELSLRLGEALQEGGVPHAIQYCNLVAYPLVDSLSEVYHAEIRRTSLRVRNPKDAPTEIERAVLLAYEDQAARGEELQPKVDTLDANTVAFYAPIRIQPLCLSCHGKIGETMKAEDYVVIRKRYPKDEATGYQESDLRGMWSITFKKND